MPRKTKDRLDRHVVGISKFLKWSANKPDSSFSKPLWAQPEVIRAAKFFGLDERSRSHRNLLLAVLADTLFGRPRRAGRPKKSTKWNRASLIQLRDDYNEVIKEHPRISDRPGADKIKDKFPDRYQHVQADALRKRLAGRSRSGQRWK
jgi:hypothetical protein